MKVQTMLMSYTIANICSFRKSDLQAPNCSIYTYSVGIHSKSVSVIRSVWKQNDIRKPEFLNRSCKYLGMLISSRTVKASLPLMTFHERWNSMMTNWPMGPTFEPFVMNWVAPDHVVVGNVRNVSLSIFTPLLCDEDRKVLNYLFHTELNSNMEIVERATYNLTKKDTNRISFSTSFAAFIFALLVIDQY